MKVFYITSVLDQVVQCIEEASKTNRTIDHILVSDAEMQYLLKELQANSDVTFDDEEVTEMWVADTLVKTMGDTVH